MQPRSFDNEIRCPWRLDTGLARAQTARGAWAVGRVRAHSPLRARCRALPAGSK